MKDNVDPDITTEADKTNSTVGVYLSCSKVPLNAVFGVYLSWSMVPWYAEVGVYVGRWHGMPSLASTYG